MDTNDVIFECPECHKKFTMTQLIDHNKQALLDYINVETEKELKVKSETYKKQVEELLKNDYEKKASMKDAAFEKEKSELVSALTKKQNEIEISKEKQASELSAQIKDWMNKYESLNNSLEDKINIEKQNLINEYSKKLNDSNTLINDLKNQLQNIKSEFNSSKENALQAKELELTNKYNELIKRKDEEISERKETISSITNSLNQLKLQLETTKKELSQANVNNLQAKELELTNKFNKLIEEKEKEINELKIQNNLNRVINNKTKGENFEHEVEGELRKAFGFVDEIQKINDTVDNKKADFLQVVTNGNKEQIGKIVYEVKNAEWKDSWIPKLMTDCANNKTKYGILIATSFSERYHDVPFIKSSESDNIFITDPYSFVFVAQLLRKMIILENEMQRQQEIFKNSNDNELLKQYQTQINAIKDFMITDLPNYQKSFNKQLESLDSVKRSLNNNGNKLDTAIHMLRSKTEKLIFARLEELTQVRLEREQASEGDE